MSDHAGHATSDLLDLARRIATTVAATALEERRRGIAVESTKSSPVDVVTAVDRETEARIRSLILDARPDDGIFGEEEDTHVGTSGLNWVVDPIDGTVNLLYDIPAWCVSIAVVDGPPDPLHWHALAGVVVNPVTGDVFEASRGGGARLGDQELHVNEDVELSKALIATGFSYSAERRRAQATTLLQVVPRIRDIRRIGSAALDLSAIALGRLDGFYERGLNPWDHAAGALVLREAGGRVGGVGGAPESSELLVAAAPSIFDELLSLVVDAGGATG
ncbi:myo-inositol-1(or 4)-monophosphatase [Agromyces flavus]|uniref:Inositol-1-monophosphatase n=1 Tax=Agromyces flavus TaxID=589382 RepID=A0A1H1XPP1_9MICO|nr:inositol monophosphatase family protein [Agromyces flavus]MCP2366479.1 myo-inositol-1(or 4)-monophosphatase [Agromyces flavus]GGI44758.1 inositol monophosphatase [Agromyces flavus]SDT11194.1 myo-inositol-1(or 4)-monophosphatase [Agromyces flavus]